MKVASIVGARPNIVKMGPVHKSLDSSGIEHLIVHTGQHYDYEMSEIFFNDFELPKPDIHLGVGSGTSCFKLGKLFNVLSERLQKKILILFLFMVTLIPRLLEQYVQTSAI